MKKPKPQTAPKQGSRKTQAGENRKKGLGKWEKFKAELMKASEGKKKAP